MYIYNLTEFFKRCEIHALGVRLGHLFEEVDVLQGSSQFLTLINFSIFIFVGDDAKGLWKFTLTGF